MRIPLLEMPDAPHIKRVNLVLQDPAEFRLPAAFQLDEVLSLLVAGKLRRLIKTAWRPAPLFRKAARCGESTIAIHPHIDGNERKSSREVGDGENGSCC